MQTGILVLVDTVDRTDKMDNQDSADTQASADCLVTAVFVDCPVIVASVDHRATVDFVA